MKVQFFGLHGKLSHIGFGASRMARYEVGYQLLSESAPAVDAVKNLLERMKLVERGLAHHFQHTLLGVLRSHFEASRHMAFDQLFIIPAVGGVRLFSSRRMHRQIIAHAASYK